MQNKAALHCQRKGWVRTDDQGRMFDAEGVRIDPSPPPRARREAADDLAHSGDITPTSYPSPGSVSGNIYRPTYNGHPTTNAVGLQGRQAFSALPESTVASGTRPQPFRAGVDLG